MSAGSLTASEANARPLVWPGHFPPTDRWKTFFSGVRWLGPDVSFFRSLGKHQSCRTAEALDLWTDQGERRIAEEIGKILQRELQWRTPYFIPADALCATFGSPSFDDWNEVDLWDLFIELDESLGIRKGPGFWQDLVDWQDNHVSLGELVCRLKAAVSTAEETGIARAGRTAPVFCGGDSWERGLQQGQGLSQAIQSLIGKLRELEAFRLQQPSWLPYGLYRLAAERKAQKFLTAALARNDPEMWHRLCGIARGANVSRGSICLFNALEPMLCSVSECIGLAHACSAVAVRGSRSANGEPMIGRNFDYLPLVQPYHLVRHDRPVSGMASLQFTVAPIAGAIDGINEAGLSITYDYAFAIDQAPAPAPPFSMIISEALERCSTVVEAAVYIEKHPRWGAGLLMLADKTGDIASLELSNTRSFLRRPPKGEDQICHTNHFEGANMRAVEAPPDAVLDDRAPAALRGRRVHESSERRSTRWVELLRGSERFTVETLASLLADHGPEGKPSQFSPCVHSGYWNTTTCMQLLPLSRKMRISFDRPCQANYHEWSL